MKIGIVGAGHIGGTLTRRLRSLGHEVAIANSRGAASLAELAEETGAVAVTAAEAVDGRDLIIFTVPQHAVPGLAPLFGAVPADTVIVDTGNYYPRQRDGRIEPIEAGKTESRWVADQLGRPVVKAFNNINWTKLLANGLPEGDPSRIALPVAGDNAAAKAKVMALINELGFDPVDAGGLDESWRQQPGSPAYGADAPRARLIELLAAASPERKPDFSGRPGDPERRG